MVALIFQSHRLVVALFKSKSRLEAENAALRQQLTVLRRKARGRVRLTSGDRLFFVELYRWFPSILKVITIVRPETRVHWHRAGFRRYWSWAMSELCPLSTRSRPNGGNRGTSVSCQLDIADPDELPYESRLLQVIRWE